MAARPKFFLIDSSVHGKEGLVESVDSNQIAQRPLWVRNETELLGIREVEPDPAPAVTRKHVYRDVDITGAELRMAIGETDLAPTSGTWTIGVSTATSGTLGVAKRYYIAAFVAGDVFTNVGAASNATGVIFAATGTTPTTWTHGSTLVEITSDLQYNETAANVSTALNATRAVLAAGGLAVTKVQTDLRAPLYRMVWTSVGARTTLLSDVRGLFPPSLTNITVETTGDVDHQEIETIAVMQRAYAEAASGDFTIVSTGAVSYLPKISEGSSSTCSSWLVQLSPEPMGGTLAFSWSRAQKYRIAVQGANNAVGENTQVAARADVAGDLNGTYFDLPSGTSGTLRVWFTNGAGVAPATPASGSLKSITFANNNSGATIAGLLVAAVYTGFTCVALGGAQVEFRETAVGVRTVLPAAGTSGFTVATTQAGTNGSMAGAWVTFEGAHGTVGVWLQCGAGTIPTDVAAAGRSVQVTIGATDTANTIAGLINTAFAADADFSSAVATSFVTLTDLVSGARTVETDSDGNLGIATTQTGALISASIPVESTGSQVQSLIDADLTYFVVTEAGPFAWLIKRTEFGDDDGVTITDEAVTWPRYWLGQLSHNVETLRIRFAGTDDETISETWQIERKFAGEEWKVILSTTVTYARNIITQWLGITPTPYGQAAALDRENTWTADQTFDGALLLFENGGGINGANGQIILTENADLVSQRITNSFAGTMSDPIFELASSNALFAGAYFQISNSAGICFLINTGGLIYIGANFDPVVCTRAKKKNNTDSRTSNTTVVADSELVIPIAAGQVWDFEFHVFVKSSSTTPGWKGGLTFPTAPTNVRWTMDYHDYDGLTITPKGMFTGDSTTTTCAFAGTTNGGEVIMRGQIRNGANAGNITLMYAQAVSNAASTLNQQQSWATATLVP